MEEWEAARCPSCGTAPHEWLTEKGELRHDLPYEATEAVCWGCATTERAEHKAAKDRDTDTAAGRLAAAGRRIRLTIKHRRTDGLEAEGQPRS